MGGWGDGTVSTEIRVPLTVMDSSDPELLDELMGAVEKVAHTGAFTLGPIVERFESAFASFCETAHAVGVSSGTEALILTLRALGLTEGNEVIVPANSFIATAEAVRLAGGTPRFADVDADTQLVTAETLSAAHTGAVRGVIPVHMFGRTVELQPILALARDWGVWVVEDCAQAHGARYAGCRAGSFGDAGTFSFYPAKNLGAWGDGGAVVTNRSDVAERVRLLRSHGESPRYHHHLVGTTGRLDALQAAVLEHKLRRLEAWNMDRRRVADGLRSAIGELGGVKLPAPVKPPADHVYHQFVVRCARRDAFRAHLASKGIATAIHYPIPIHRSPAFMHLTQGGDIAPTATRLASEICSLPIFPSMCGSQTARVGEAVRQFAVQTGMAQAASAGR